MLKPPKLTKPPECSIQWYLDEVISKAEKAIVSYPSRKFYSRRRSITNMMCCYQTRKSFKLPKALYD